MINHLQDKSPYAGRGAALFKKKKKNLQNAFTVRLNSLIKTLQLCDEFKKNNKNKNLVYRLY